MFWILSVHISSDWEIQFSSPISLCLHSYKESLGGRFSWRPKHSSTLCCRLWTLTLLPISRIKTCLFFLAPSWCVSGVSISPATRPFSEPWWPTPTTAQSLQACWSLSTGAPFYQKHIVENTTTALLLWRRESKGRQLGWMDHLDLSLIRGHRPCWFQTRPYTLCPRPTFWHVSMTFSAMTGSCMSRDSALQVSRWHMNTMTQDFMEGWCSLCGRPTSWLHVASQTTISNGSRKTCKNSWLSMSIPVFPHNAPLFD